MTPRRLIFLALMIALLAPAMAAAAPAATVLAGPCLAGGSYDPACDVDHNGVIDILDIQLTAGRWNQSGVWTADGWSLTGNAGTTPGTNFMGTTDNQALELRVNGSRALLIQPGLGGNNNIIGGQNSNGASVGVYAATISGGSSSWVYDTHGAVGGGLGNTAGSNDGAIDNASYATVGGGRSNAAISTDATVAGGAGNTASGNNATVSGGEACLASGDWATVGGGYNNHAAGSGATVPGGANNLADADFSFAAGRRAKAVHEGSFVWADNQGTDFNSTAANTFRVRALNGAFIQANNASYAGVVDNDGTGDGLRAYTASSRGVDWAAVYAHNTGTSPGLVAQSGGTYAGYFNDQIFVTGGCTGCTLMYVAQNAGDAALRPGDLVAPAGIDVPLAGAVDPVLRVIRADTEATGVVGVVYRRVAVMANEKDGEVLDSVQAVDGAAEPGDRLLIVVQGLAEVKVAGGVAAGERLTVAGAGVARATRDVEPRGLNTPMLGMALDAPDAVTGMAPVLVTLR